MIPLPHLAATPATRLHVAGIGASAGGLEAMLPMFAQMRPTGRVTYVVAQHMAKDGHDELVVRLINRESALPVVLAQQGERLMADTVYVIPSGKDGTVSGTTLSLHEPGPGNISTPSVNTLFSSIAASSRDNAIGIVLSGTGYDGVAGCRELKSRGGLTIAQDPAEAKFNGMPSAAIDARLVDRVLPVGSIGGTLAELFPGKALSPRKSVPQVTQAFTAEAVENKPATENRELAILIPLVHKATGIDFSSYKEETLLRRLERRMATLGITAVDDYLALARSRPEELKTLQHLFLVSVSSFFRDHESFQVLKMSLSKLVAGKPGSEPIRLWVPGCASGEEPVTLAILLKELAGERPLEITATDLNPEALAIAREGTYRQTAFKEMDAAMRERYFTPKGQHFALKPDILARIRYEQRDVLGGTPPANLDLVSCRNLLIYMKSHLQDTLIKSFHTALRPQGLLFIGQSESLSFVGNSLFSPIDHYHRLFRRRH